MTDRYKEELLTPIAEKTDVLVVGGGPAGVVAAIAAARNGAKVTLIEKNIILGGLATAGHVCLFEPLCDGKGRKVTKGIVEEMLHLSIRYSYNTLPYIWGQDVDFVKDPENAPGLPQPNYIKEKGRYCTLFNVPAFALALEEAVLQEKIRLLYDTAVCDVIMDGNVCKGVVVENLSGRSVYQASVVIDATGYCTLFHRAGAPTQSYANHFSVEYYETDFDSMRRGIETGDMTKAIRWGGSGWNPLTKTGGPDRVYYGTNAQDINDFVIDSHQESLKKLKNRSTPDYCMVSISTMPHIRMARRIVGRQTMRSEDVFVRQENSVGCVSDWRKPGPVYEVPFGCLFDKNIKNMMAAGRVISADDDAWDIMRCYPGAMVTGQAAGTTAAIAVEKGIFPDEVETRELQTRLEHDKVMLHI